VVDASHPRVDAHIQAVESILEGLGVAAIPTLYVFNKMDQADPDATRGLLARHGGVAISARDPATLGPLLDELDRRLVGSVELSAHGLTEVPHIAR
jgi:GTP-binding protein HflX